MRQLSYVVVCMVACMPSYTYTFTFNPNPPEAGKSCTITFDGPPNSTLTLDWDPPSEPTTLVTRHDGTVTFVVPDDADSLIIRDGDGHEDGTTISH